MDKQNFKNKMLLKAALEGNFRIVKDLITKHNIDVNHTNTKGRSALFLSTRSGHFPIVQFLLEHDADVNLVSKNRISPLFISAHQGHIGIAKLLIDNGANVDLVCEDGSSSLYISAEQGHIDIVRLLIDRGADVNLVCEGGSSSLYISAEKGHIDIVRLLIDKGADVNLVCEDGSSSLFISAQHGHIDIVRLLIDRGADVNLVREDGASPLIISAQNGHIDIAKLLIDSGANINQIGDCGTSPLYICVQKGDVDMAKFLIESGADVDQAYNGWSPIAKAANDNNLMMVELLQPSATSSALSQALQMSIRNRNETISRFLLESGADKAFYMEISHDEDGKKFLNNIKTEAEALALQEELLAELEQHDLEKRKEKAKIRAKKSHKEKVEVKPEASDNALEKLKEKETLEARKSRPGKIEVKSEPSRIILEELKEEKTEKKTLQMVSKETSPDEIEWLRVELAKSKNKNEELRTCVEILENANEDLKEEIQQLRDRQYLSPKEQYLFEARRILEDVIETHFVKMDTTAASIAAISADRRELREALNYFRAAGNCICHSENLSALRAGNKTQFTKEQVLVYFRVLHNELPEYSPSFRARFWNY